jgi:prostatic aicd phosphatase
VSTAREWCGECRSEAVFCAAYRDDGKAGVDVTSAAGGDEGGVVSKGGWIAVLVVMAVAILGNFIWAAMWLVGRKGGKKEEASPAMAGPVKSVSSHSDAESV